MFRALASDQFAPFGTLKIEFPPVPEKQADLAEVHVFTGINGTGKTRLLSLLAATLGNPSPLLRKIKGTADQCRIYVADEYPGSQFSRLDVSVNESDWANHSKFTVWARSVAAFAYSGVAYLTDASISIVAEVPKPTRDSCLSFVRLEEHSQSVLQSITNLKLQAAMDSFNTSEGDGPSRYVMLMKTLEGTITQITGRPFLFTPTTQPKVELAVTWGGQKLRFDALPDGLRAIIGWLAHAVVMMDTWLQGSANPLGTEAVFLLDEIESSLHPAWQRRILPAFQRLFPKAQIFIATHSPFVIASINHGWIHPLTLTPDGTVAVQKPIPASEGDSYVSVLEDIMGVHEWYDPETEGLMEEFRARRNSAYHGDAGAAEQARVLASKIGGRSAELEYMMGRELSQMDRQLAKASVSTK